MNKTVIPFSSHLECYPFHPNPLLLELSTINYMKQLKGKIIAKTATTEKSHWLVKLSFSFFLKLFILLLLCTKIHYFIWNKKIRLIIYGFKNQSGGLVIDTVFKKIWLIINNWILLLVIFKIELLHPLLLLIKLKKYICKNN